MNGGERQRPQWGPVPVTGRSCRRPTPRSDVELDGCAHCHWHSQPLWQAQAADLQCSGDSENLTLSGRARAAFKRACTRAGPGCRGAAHSTVAKRNAVCTALCAGAGVNRRGAPSHTDVPMAALPPPRSVWGLFLVFWFVPCFWVGRSTLKGVNFRPIRPLLVGAGMGSC